MHDSTCICPPTNTKKQKILFFYTLEHQHPGNRSNAPLVDGKFAPSAHKTAHTG
jgi:hypothetical protein